MSFKIGNIEIKNKVILAPMAGITSFSYRKLMKKFGVSLTYTEMISDCGLNYKNNNTYKLLQSDGSDRPLALQLFGGSEETLLKAIDEIQSLDFNYDILDLNLGCPVPKVTRSNGGSSWLKDPEKLYSMLSKVVAKSNKPVSVKIRLGFDKINLEDNLRVIEKAGVSFVVIHARTRSQGYTGIADYNALKNVRDIISIPFGVSGDIFSVKDALRALEITKADCVMVARGGVGNPELCSNILKALNNEEYNEEINIERQKEYLKEFAKDLCNELGEHTACQILKGLAPKFFTRTSNTKDLRIKITQNLNSFLDLCKILDEEI